MKWCLWLWCEESRDTIVFERLDGSFCRISSVYVWQDQLIVYALFSNGSFERLGCFVVELLEWRLESAFDKILVQVVVRSQVFRVRAIAHGLGKDGITVVVVQNENVFLASTGRGGKFAGLVSGDLAGGVVDGSKYLMGAFVWRLRDRLIVERVLWLRFGRSKILALLVEMGFDRGS